MEGRTLGRGTLMMEKTQTPLQQLEEILVQTDTLSVSDAGDLLIDTVAARDLVEEFGSPLFVFSEKTLRANFRRIRSAFEKEWPKPVNIMYAIKSNSNFAIRAIMHQEGAGGDCFGIGEIEATFTGGADPEKIVLNSSFKSPEAMRRAVELGVRIVVEVEEDIEDLQKIAEDLNRDPILAIRLKVVPEAFKEFESDQYQISGDARPRFLRSKWGVTREKAAQMIHRIRESARLSLEGYHAHFGRMSADPALMVEWQKEYAKMIVSLYRETGFAPSIIDIGGGWPRERDPESRSLAMNRHPIETYVNAVSAVLLKGFQEAGISIPGLWVEPGRYISGNAGTLLTTVGPIKRDAGFVTVNVDASTNILRDHFSYTILAAENMFRPCTMKVDIVGPTCIPSILGQDRPMPDIGRGEILAVLDAGCYAESYANHLNSIPLPASVLVNDGQVDVIREADTIEYMFANQRIPERLKGWKVRA